MGRTHVNCWRRCLALKHREFSWSAILRIDERATLGWMLFQPQAPGAREALLHLESIRDVRISARGPVVQVDLVDVVGAGDPNDVLELSLRRWMEQISSFEPCQAPPRPG